MTSAHIACQFTRQNKLALQYASKNMVVEMVTHDRFLLAYASEYLKDREVVLAAVAKDGLALQFALPTQKKDEKVVLAAITQNPQALKYASEELQVKLKREGETH
jgi:O-glycosyl hydrolase